VPLGARMVSRTNRMLSLRRLAGDAGQRLSRRHVRGDQRRMAVGHGLVARCPVPARHPGVAGSAALPVNRRDEVRSRAARPRRAGLAVGVVTTSPKRRMVDRSVEPPVKWPRRRSRIEARVLVADRRARGRAAGIDECRYELDRSEAPGPDGGAIRARCRAVCVALEQPRWRRRAAGGRGRWVRRHTGMVRRTARRDLHAGGRNPAPLSHVAVEHAAGPPRSANTAPVVAGAQMPESAPSAGAEDDHHQPHAQQEPRRWHR
jgi:hypothetical protein